MAVSQIHRFLVHPAKRVEEQPQIGGTQVPKRGQLYEMLASIYAKAPTECDIDVLFRPDDQGHQVNPCRDELVSYVRQPNVAHGRQVAARLQVVTTLRSGLGLLFLMTGKEGTQSRLVVSRFPADQGIIAEEKRDRLSVAFIERVFMKNAKAYKSVYYQSDSLDRGFWDGRAVDRQVSGPKELSDYWLREFLVSELRTPGPAGTKRIATALRAATRSAGTPEVRHELVSAASLIRGQDGKTTTARQLVDRLGLTEEAVAALEHEFARPELMDEAFRFDRDEFERHVLYRMTELDNGAILLAEDEQFDEVFEQTPVSTQSPRTRFATEGQVIDERLRRTR